MQAEPGHAGVSVASISSSSPGLAVAAEDSRILLVEDNLVNQKVATLLLKKLGFTPSIAGNGREALAAMAEKKYDLVLMDCLMPEMDGFQATRAIRNTPNHNQEIPIIALTANAFVQDREACLASGMSDYLVKPVREAELHAILKKWLGKRETEALAHDVFAEAASV